MAFLTLRGLGFQCPAKALDFVKSSPAVPSHSNQKYIGRISAKIDQITGAAFPIKRLVPKPKQKTFILKTFEC